MAAHVTYHCHACRAMQTGAVSKPGAVIPDPPDHWWAVETSNSNGDLLGDWLVCSIGCIGVILEKNGRPDWCRVSLFRSGGRS